MEPHNNLNVRPFNSMISIANKDVFNTLSQDLFI